MMRTNLIKVSLLLVLTLAGGIVRAQTPTAFTYQGRLTDAGAPANGTYDFEFKLFDASATQLGTAVTREDVTVTNGVFLVRLDFGVSPFTPNATASTLEIGVRPGTSTASFTTLSPRQPITSTPYAVQTINAEKLGGVDANQYVKTDDPRLGGSGNNSYVQNSTVQQPGVGFNIGGNGLFGGQVGIGTQTPGIGLKLDVNGVARFMPGGTGGAIQFGTPNGETGTTISNQFTRADIRFDGGLLKLVAGPAGGPPSYGNGIGINTEGNVIIGPVAATTGKLSILASPSQPALYAESANRGLWGKSTGSSYGVFGESGSGIGVQGVSTSNVGTVGASTSHVGVYGSTGASDPAKPGVLGVSTGTGGVGVRGDGATGVFGNSTVANGIGVTGTGTTGVYGNSAGGVGVTGEANANNSIGVFGKSNGGTALRGESTSGTGYGLYAKNPGGYAMYAEGGVGQTPMKGGFVKAMLAVNADGTIRACFNSQLADGGASLPPSGSSGCGLSVTFNASGIQGLYRVNVGFPFAFHSVTAGNSGSYRASASASSGGTDLFVYIYLDDRRAGFGALADFVVIIY